MSVARTLWNQHVKVHDGTEIALDVMLPPGGGPFPTVILRTPYVRGSYLKSPRSWMRLLDHGYAFVVVDIRGRNDSGGDWRLWIKDPEDGHDVIEWVAGQSWCSGKIGMVGGSYDGVTQWWTAAGRPPHLSCIVPLCTGHTRQTLSNFNTGIPVQYWLWLMNSVSGKTMQYSGAPSWEDGMMHLPLKTLDERLGLSRSAWQQYVADEIDPSSPDSTLSNEDYANIDIPVLIGVGWWDDQETIVAWKALQQAKSVADCRLLIGAWDHVGNIAPRPVLGGLDVSASVMDTIGYMEKFLALHLKGEQNDIAEAPRCHIFRTGEQCWDDLDQWPHPQAVDIPMYLASGGDARSLRGNGWLSADSVVTSGSDTYIYDPNNPGRDMSNMAVFAWSDPPLDCRYLQRRQDILVYDSEPFAVSLMLSGRIRLRAHISSDRPDTDLYVGISDVHPDGRAIGLFATNEPGCGLRLRYRNGPVAELLKPGEIYEVEVNGPWVHHVFKAGHRLRVTVNSNNFTLMARNAGSGKHWAEDDVLYPQTNTLYHSPDKPSQVILPVVPAEVH